jgi:predicted enzyme related to lactoylglutathione lyase
MNNRVVHFEIPSDDPEKTMNFFKDVFGWSFQQFGNEKYWFARTGDENAPGINGAVMIKHDPRQPVVNTISIENIDESIERIEKAGGKIMLPKMAVPNTGWVAYFNDPGGNIHGVWQNDPEAK